MSYCVENKIKTGCVPFHTHGVDFKVLDQESDTLYNSSEGDQEIAVKIAASELFSKFKNEKTGTLSTNEFFILIEEASEVINTLTQLG